MVIVYDYYLLCEVIQQILEITIENTDLWLNSFQCGPAGPAACSRVYILRNTKLICRTHFYDPLWIWLAGDDGCATCSFYRKNHMFDPAACLRQ